ncbi:carbohydrate-binding family 9-like protein [Allomuricauda sp. d1]|uniref:carbohydrate-binding family 9-like protein n=1 Tax=Allomuricauda sp. d1 TaxID=3136725 RepID=UPI0031E34FAA
MKTTTTFIVYTFLAATVELFGQFSHAPRTYVAYKTTDKINVDGLADEVSWKKSPFTDNFIDIEGIKKPKFEAKAKMLWDEENFYVFARMEEPHVWGNLKQRDTIIFYNNDFEIFIDPDGDTHNYYELEINSLNTPWDLFLTKPYRNGGKVLDSWDAQGLKSAIYVDGTINDPSDLDKGWSIEIAIPWSAITEAASDGNLPENKYWRVNFSRVNWDFNVENGNYHREKDASDNYLPEYNWVWSPQWVVNMHEPEHWGYVFFSGNMPERPTEFSIPKDEHVKWMLYEWYRKLHGDINQKLPKYATVFEEQIALNLETHRTGWNLWCISPFSGEQLIIKNDGKFIKKE